MHSPMHRFDIEEKPQLSLSVLKRIGGYFKPYKFMLVLSSLIILVTTALALVPPLLLRTIVDHALPEKNTLLLLQSVVFSFLAYLALNLLQVGQGTINMNISRNITYNMKNQMYAHLQHMSQRFFSSEKQGEINTRMSSDIDGVQNVFNATFVSLLSSLFTLATTLFTLFSLNWRLALLSLLTIPIYILPTRRVGRLRWQITKELQEELSQLNQHTQETLSISGSTLMKVFTTEEQEFSAFQAGNEAVSVLQKREELTGRWYRMLMNLLTLVGPLLVYLVGGLYALQGQLSIGTILMFATLLDRLYRPVMQLLNLHMDTLRSFALFERIFQYLDLPQEVVSTSDTPLHIQGGRIDFSQVNFSYDNEKTTLNKVSFTALPGQVTALVGASGAGKTTITNLIPRLYDLSSGSITIDGQDISHLSLQSLRSHIGMVTQEPYLFNGSIWENITYGATGEVTRERVEEVAKTAYIHDFILSLPHQYDTVVGNRGIKLSGGEKQRISIARVLLKDPSILILDEATSALDSLSEDIVQRAIEPLMKNRTSIVIAHRLSTIQSAHQILVLDKGDIVESGTHYQLLDKKGVYATLHQKQFEKWSLDQGA